MRRPAILKSKPGRCDCVNEGPSRRAGWDWDDVGKARPPANGDRSETADSGGCPIMRREVEAGLYDLLVGLRDDCKGYKAVLKGLGGKEGGNGGSDSAAGAPDRTVEFGIGFRLGKGSKLVACCVGCSSKVAKVRKQGIRVRPSNVWNWVGNAN